MRHHRLFVYLVSAACFSMPSAADEPAPDFRQTTRQALIEILSKGSNTSTKEFVEEIAASAGIEIATSAAGDSLLALLGEIEDRLDPKDGPFAEVITSQAQASGIEPDKARRFVARLAARTRAILEKGNIYLIKGVIDGEAKKTGIAADLGRAFLLRTVERLSAASPSAPSGPPPVLVVQAFGHANPFGWKTAPSTVSEIPAVAAVLVQWYLMQEISALSIFEEVITRDPQKLAMYPPTHELTLHGAWLAKNLPDQELKRNSVDSTIPPSNGTASQRLLDGRRGLLSRFELRDLAADSLLARWYSFCEMEFPKGDRPQKLQTYLEEPHRTILRTAVEATSPSRHKKKPPDQSAGGESPSGESAGIQSPSDESAGIGSPSGRSADIPIPPGVAFEQVPPETGLLVEGRSSYDLKRQLHQFADLADQGPQHLFFAFFGTRDTSAIRTQVTDIHRKILPLLAAEIRESPLRYVRWKGAYRLRFDVRALDFWAGNQTDTDWTPVEGMAQISVVLEHLPDRRILLDHKPPFIVQVTRAEPGGKPNMDELCRLAAERIFQILDQYWTTEHPAMRQDSH